MVSEYINSISSGFCFALFVGLPLGLLGLAMAFWIVIDAVKEWRRKW